MNKKISSIPKEGEIYDYLVKNLHHKKSSNKPLKDRLKHLYCLLYYLRKQRINGEDYNRIKAIEKTIKESPTVNTKSSVSASINHNESLDWSEPDDFDPLYQEEKYDEILDRIVDRYNLDDHDRDIFAKILDMKINLPSKKVHGFRNVKLNIDISLYFPYTYKEMIKKRIKTSLANGKHLILIGPPGTGKSKLAKIICKSYVEDDWKMSTATSDWTTFDTIGGYRMKENKSLVFRPGIFLKCFQDEHHNQKNDWLIIDEINRADIDKAFGSLFSALTGDDIILPYEVENKVIKVHGDSNGNVHSSPTDYIIPNDWRIIATMNTFDKASLYTMSYAFMRRFAFIEIGIPKNIDNKLVENYIDCWDDVKKDDEIIDDVCQLWKCINDIRPIGPAILKDIYMYLLKNSKDYVGALTLFVYPQFEGVSKNKHEEFIGKITDINFNNGDVNEIELVEFVNDFFRIEIDLDKNSGLLK